MRARGVNVRFPKRRTFATDRVYDWNAAITDVPVRQPEHLKTAISYLPVPTKWAQWSGRASFRILSFRLASSG
jgi:hypothetical protein